MQINGQGEKLALYNKQVWKMKNNWPIKEYTVP